MLTSERRVRDILEFISTNQGCNVQTLVKGLEHRISRQTIFNTLNELRNQGQVTVDRKKPNSRDLRLYVKQNNPLYSVPRELEQFEGVFIPFLEGIAHQNKQTIRSLKQTLSIRFQDYKKMEGKNENEKLKLNELEQLIETNIDIQEEFNELSYHLSLFVRALDIFSQFSQIFTIRYLVEWSMIIRDKDLLNNLASVVFTKIFGIQKQILEIIRLGTVDNLPDPIAREVHEVKFFDLTEALIRSMDGWRDLDEISQFYEHADLKKEVKPVMDSISKLSKNLQIIQSHPMELGKKSVISPLDWSAETVYEFNHPNKYYRDIMDKEFEEFEDNKNYDE